MKIVAYMIIVNLFLFNSCNLKTKRDKNYQSINKISLNTELQNRIKQDLKCFKINYSENRNKLFFDLYCEKVNNKIEIHINQINQLQIDKKCLGVLFIDSSIFCVYGDFFHEIYKHNGQHYFNKNYFLKKYKKSKNNLFEFVSWHYLLKDGKLLNNKSNNLCE